MHSRVRHVVALGAVVLAAGLLAGASPYSDYVVANTGPVFYWNLDDAPGSTTADDLIGTNDGAYAGTAQPGAVGPRPADGFSSMGSGNAAGSMDTYKTGSTWHTGAVDHASLNTGAGVGTSTYSVQTWFKLDPDFNQLSLDYILGRGNGRVSGTDLRDSISVGGNYHTVDPGVMYLINGKTSNPGGARLDGSTVLSPNTWYHTVFTRDGEEVRVYLNGQVEIQGSMVWQTAASSDPQNRGNYFSAANRVDYPNTSHLGLRGDADEVAVWDRALTPCEANLLYQYAKGVPPYAIAVLSDCPEAYWRLNETSPDNTAVDASGHGHDFTYDAEAKRSGIPPEVGPRGGSFAAGFEPTNNAPMLYRTFANPSLDNRYVGTVSGILPAEGGQAVNDYSAEMWLRLEFQDPGRGSYLLHRSDLGASRETGDFLGVKYDSASGENRLFVFAGDPSVQNRMGANAILEDEWYHVGMVREGDDVSVYLNGVLDIQLELLVHANVEWDDGTWTIGNRLNMLSNQQRFNGNIDEVAIYRGVLDQGVFQAHWSAAVPEPASCLLLAGGLLAIVRRRERGR